MHDLVMHMFTLAPPALETVLEKVARPVVVYLFLVIALRLGGKRELAQLNPLDLVVLLTLSNTVQNAIIGEDNTVTGGLIGATTLLALNHLVVRYAFRHPRVERFIEGEATVLIDKGIVKRSNLAASSYRQASYWLPRTSRASRLWRTWNAQCSNRAEP